MRLVDLPRFPCGRINKAPLVASGFRAATTDLKQIAEWQQQFPRALWGIPCGDRTFDVLDLDGAPGRKWLCEHESRLPETRVQITPRGRHYYFQPAPGLRPSVGKIAKGCDVRAGNLSYVIGWCLEGFPVVDRPLAPWPQWLLDLLAAKREGCTPRACSEIMVTQRVHLPFEPTINLSRRTDQILRVIEQAKPGTRNARLYWAACRFGEIMTEGRLQPGVVVQLLKTAVQLCGLVRDDGDRAVTATILSGLRRGSHA